MQELDLKQVIIHKLISLNKKGEITFSAESANENLEIIKIELQGNLDKLEKTSKIYEIAAYILLAILLIVSFIKVLDISKWPDLNKAGLLILFTATTSLHAFHQKNKVERLKMQIMLLDILEMFSSK